MNFLKWSGVRGGVNYRSEEAFEKQNHTCHSRNHLKGSKKGEKVSRYRLSTAPKIFLYLPIYFSGWGWTINEKRTYLRPKCHGSTFYEKRIIYHNVRKKDNWKLVSGRGFAIAWITNARLLSQLVGVFLIIYVFYDHFLKDISCHSFYNFWPRFIVFPMKLHFLSSY